MVTDSGTAPPTAADVAAATAVLGTGPSATGDDHREVVKSTPSTPKDIKVNIHVTQNYITAIPSVSLQKKVMEWNTADMLNQEPLPVDAELNWEIMLLKPGTDIEVVNGKNLLPFKVKKISVNDKSIEGHFYEVYDDKNGKKWKINPGKALYSVSFGDYVHIMK